MVFHFVGFIWKINPFNLFIFASQLRSFVKTVEILQKKFPIFYSHEMWQNSLQAKVRRKKQVSCQMNISDYQQMLDNILKPLASDVFYLVKSMVMMRLRKFTFPTPT